MDSVTLLFQISVEFADFGAHGRRDRTTVGLRCRFVCAELEQLHEYLEEQRHGIHALGSTEILFQIEKRFPLS